MTDISEKNLRKRLSWIDDARAGLVSAIGEDVVSATVHIHTTVDPLRLILKIALKRQIEKATRAPLREWLRIHAEADGCELPIINIGKRSITAELLIKHRLRRDHVSKKPSTKRFSRRPR